MEVETRNRNSDISWLSLLNFEPSQSFPSSHTHFQPFFNHFNHGLPSLTPTTHPRAFQHIFKLPNPSTSSYPPIFRISMLYLAFLGIFTHCQWFLSPTSSLHSHTTLSNCFLNQPPIFEPTNPLFTLYPILNHFYMFSTFSKCFYVLFTSVKHCKAPECTTDSPHSF